jgi:hypothetical protein
MINAHPRKRTASPLFLIRDYMVHSPCFRVQKDAFCPDKPGAPGLGAARGQECHPRPRLQAYTVWSLDCCTATPPNKPAGLGSELQQGAREANQVRNKTCSQRVAGGDVTENQNVTQGWVSVHSSASFFFVRTQLMGQGRVNL